MKSFACLSFFLISATAGWTQGITFWPDPIIDCLDYGDGASGRYACIGTASNLCTADNPGGFSTAGMSACLESERAWWDARLNSLYGQLMAQWSRQPELQDELRAMQRAWITFRDARCALEVAQWQGGTGATPAFLACQMAATAEQSFVLEDQLR